MACSAVVEVVEVRVQPHADHPDEVGLEDRQARSREKVVVREESGQEVHAVAGHAPRPRQVVQPEDLGTQLLARVSGERRDGLHGPVGSVADPDRPGEPGIAERLGHHPGRVGEAVEPRVRAGAVEQLRVAEDGRDVPKAHREPAGAGGLLPEDPVPQGDALVQDPAALPADADRRDDVVGAVEGGSRIGRGLETDRASGLADLIAHEGREQLEPFAVDVHQDQLVEADPGCPAQRRGREERRPHAGADQDELHGPTVPMDGR